MAVKVKSYALGALLIATIGAGLGFVFSNSYEFGFCYSDIGTATFDISCHSFYGGLGNPLLYGMGALAIVFAILIAVPSAFNAWKKFAIWFVPAAALLFIFYSGPSSGDLFSPYPEQVYKWVSLTYIAISIGIIAFCISRTRKKD